MAKFLSIGFGVYASSQFHNHLSPEISIYTAGSGEALIGDEVHPFRPGTIILYPPVIPHRERSKRDYSEFWVSVDHLDLEGLPRTFQDTPQKTVERLASLLHEEHHAPQPAEAMTQTLFDLMLAHFQRMRSTPSQHPEVSRLRHILEQNIGNAEFNLAKAMRGLALSPGHLKTLFRQATGKSPARYLMDLRLGQAKHLLREGYSVKEAAFHVGFEDPYYFSRRFLLNEGQRPSVFKGAGH
jgi:AraC family transcriptional regulator of arabinose operon